MVISASRRTDVPAFYSEWFMKRVREGFVCVRNPFNANQISKIELSPDVVDCIVFWSKNPKNIMKHLSELDDLGYKYYFQFSLTPYGNEIEKGLVVKKGLSTEKEIKEKLHCKSEIIETFKELSKKIGKEKVIWRYDPILMGGEIDINWHIEEFTKLVKELKNYTKTVVISFLDEYAKIKNRCQYVAPTLKQMKEIGDAFSKIAISNGLQIKTCCEEIAFENGITKAACVDKELIEKIINQSQKQSLSNQNKNVNQICINDCGEIVEEKNRIKINAKKDGQRAECCCMECIDIGEYDTCLHGCTYCYANGENGKIKSKALRHNVNSPLLIGEICESDKVTERKVKSFKEKQ
jgi:hypothetical protein